MILRLLLFVFLAQLLRADSVFSPKVLYELGVQNPQLYSPLYIAAKQHHLGALQLLSSNAIAHKNLYWIDKSAEIGALDSLLYLAKHASDALSQKHYLSRAAKLGDGESQFQLAGLSTNSSVKLRLLENAALTGHKQAIVSLYYLFNQLGKADEDNQWFSQAAEADSHLAQVYADYLWLHQSPEISLQWLHSQGLNQNDEIKQQSQGLIASIEQTRWQKAEVQLSNHRRGHSQCALNIQFIAGSLQAINQIAELSQRFQSDPRFASFPICFTPPVWVAPDELACSNAADKRLTCSLQTVTELASTTDFTHAIVIADNGIANVHNGVMFLDRQDDYKVFLHELAHFAGFVDEYEIDQKIAKRLCTSSQAPNLVYGESKPSINATEFAQYQAEYKDLVLTKTATCEQTTANAYKPVKQTTFMEHHDIGVIPDLYLKIWRDSLNDKLGLTPIYVNFAQWFESTGHTEKAGYWWGKYNNYRS